MITFRFIAYQLFPFLCLAYGLVKFKHLSKRQKLIMGLGALAFLSQTVSRWMSFAHGTNYPVYHVYLILATFWYAIVLHDILSQSKWKFVLYLITPLLLATEVYASFKFGFAVFPSLHTMLLSIYLVVFSLIGINISLEKPSLIPLPRMITLIFLLTTLFFYTFNYFFFGFYAITANINYGGLRMFDTFLFVSNIILYYFYFYCIRVDGNLSI